MVLEDQLEKGLESFVLVLCLGGNSSACTWWRMKDARLAWRSDMDLGWLLPCLNWFMTNNPGQSTGITSRYSGSEQDRPKELPLWVRRYGSLFAFCLTLRATQHFSLQVAPGSLRPHWFMLTYIHIFFYLIFCLPGYPGSWFHSFKSHFQKPYLLHAPLTANILSLTQRATAFVEVAMTQTCLHWCSLRGEMLPKKL